MAAAGERGLGGPQTLPRWVWVGASQCPSRAGPDTLVVLDGRPVADATRAFVRTMARRRRITLPGDPIVSARRLAEQAGFESAREGEGDAAAAEAAPSSLSEPPQPAPTTGAAAEEEEGGGGGGVAASTEDAEPSSSSDSTSYEAPLPALRGAYAGRSLRGASDYAYSSGPPLPPHADPEGQGAPAQRPTRTPGDLSRGSRFWEAARADAALRLRLQQLGAGPAPTARRQGDASERAEGHSGRPSPRNMRGRPGRSPRLAPVAEGWEAHDAGGSGMLSRPTLAAQSGRAGPQSGRPPSILCGGHAQLSARRPPLHLQPLQPQGRLAQAFSSRGASGVLAPQASDSPRVSASAPEASIPAEPEQQWHNK